MNRPSYGLSQCSSIQDNSVLVVFHLYPKCFPWNSDVWTAAQILLTALWHGTKWTKIIEHFLKLFGKYYNTRQNSACYNCTFSAQLSLGSFQSKINLDRGQNSNMGNCTSSMWFWLCCFLFGVENQCNLVGKDGW